MMQKKWKKQSVVRRILHPLIGVVVLEAIIFILTTWVSGAETELVRSASDTLDYNASKLAGEISKNFTEVYGDLWTLAQATTDKLNEIKAAEGMTAKGVVTTDRTAEALLDAVSENLMDTISMHKCTGIFVVLSSGREYLSGEYTLRYPCRYYRDTDYTISPYNHSDIVLVKDEFVSSPQYLEHMKFYYQPYYGAVVYPQHQVMDLGYWSEPFVIAPQEGDTFEIITYSVPLVTEPGEVYGVMGVAYSLSSLKESLYGDSVGGRGETGFALVSYDKEAGIEAGFEILQDESGLFADGLDAQYTLSPKGSSNNLFVLNDVTYKNRDIYVAVEELDILEDAKLTENRAWAIVAVADHASLFRSVVSIRNSVIIAFIVSLAVGISVTYIVVKRNVRPIEKLSKQVLKQSYDKALVIEECGVAELDELGLALTDLSQARMNVMAELREERTRFLAALESTSDVIFEYDVQKDICIMHNFKDTDEQGNVMNNYMKGFSDRLLSELIHPEDYHEAQLFLCGKHEEKTEIRLHGILGNADYRWYRISSKSYEDKNGELQRIIGNLRDVHEERVLADRKSEASKRDGLTGLHRVDYYKPTLRRFMLTFGQDAELHAALVDLDNMSMLNGKYSAVHMDMVMASVGSVMRKTYPQNVMCSRLGGNEFLIVMMGASDKDATEFFAKVKRDFESQYVGEADGVEDRLSCTMSATHGLVSEDIDEIVHRLKCAMAYAKQNRRGGIVPYRESMFKDKLELAGLYRFSRISNYYKSGEDALVSFTFTLFEYTNDLYSTMQMYMRRLGDIFKLGRIYIMRCDSDFHTCVIEQQWCKDGLEPLPQTMEHYEPQHYYKMERLVEIAKGVLVINKRHKAEFRKMRYQSLMACEEGAAIFSGILENGVVCGNIVLMDVENEERRWTETEMAAFREILKVMGAYISKSKHDAASKAKSDFLSRMSHEIRTPMNAILGMTHIAQGNCNDPKLVGEYLGKIDSSAKYLLSLLNDILDMSRIESGKLTLSVVPVDLQDVLENVENLMRPTTVKNEQNFVVEKKVVWPMVHADALRLNQVLINLLGNATKFTPAGGSITLSVFPVAEKEDEVVYRFSVKDTGIGISEENIIRVFNSFEQAEDDTARKFGGTGLGLAISYNLVELMGGKLLVQSQEMIGSTFYFEIALKKVKEQAQNTDSASDLVRRGEVDFKGKRVLLVEDNEINIEIAEVVLEGMGFVVEKAYNGKEGLDMFEQSAPGYYDAILMDIRMPVMDGLEATRAIRILARSDARLVPIIAMSANAFDEDMRKSIESGMNGHMAKPIDFDKLSDMLGEILFEKR